MSLDKSERDNRIVYGVVQMSDYHKQKGLCFIFEKQALWLKMLWNFANKSKTWGEFLSQLPSDDYESFIGDKADGQHQSLSSEEFFFKTGKFKVPDDKELLNSKEICLFYKGEKLKWPFTSMLDWVPEDIIKTHGKINLSILSGEEYLYFQPESEKELVELLEGCGFIVNRNDELIQQTKAGDFWYFVM